MEEPPKTSPADTAIARAGAIYFAKRAASVKCTPPEEIDLHLARLEAHKREWARIDIEQRLELLAGARNELTAVRDRWVQLEVEAKGVAARDFCLAEERIQLAQAFRAIRQIETTLKHIARSEQGATPRRMRPGPDGQVVFRTFPHDMWDRFIFQATTGDVWIEPGVSAELAAGGKTARYNDTCYEGKVALVLGAGNSSMLPLCDTFHKLFVDLQVVILKMNPVNAHLGTLVEQALGGLIERGFVAVAYGGEEVGSYLGRHPLVEELHMTGSDKTYEAIVFGSGREGQRHRLQHQPVTTKRFTAELGNVTPVIVVPGPWTEGDIREYANHIATWLVANAGFACLTPRVIIQHRSWALRKALTAAIRADLGAYPTRKAYYPGAFDIHHDFVTEHPEAALIGEAHGDHLPWTIIPDVDPRQYDDICFRREGFGGLTAELPLDAQSAEEYLRKAVAFANNTLWGSLCAVLIVHPRSLRNPNVRAAVERAIADLHYGTVSLNMLAFYSSYFMVTPWGAFPGHDIYNIQSGIGKNFNFGMLDHVQKVVVRAPFHRIDPLRIRSKKPHIFARKLLDFEIAPSGFRLVNLMTSAVGG